VLSQQGADEYDRRATDESILAVQIFDQKKFKKKDQGFLGVVNVRIGSVLDLDVGGDGEYSSDRVSLAHAYTTYRDAH
jgi:E3 ubiquitin-protein ligase NEDD4